MIICAIEEWATADFGDDLLSFIKQVKKEKSAIDVKQALQDKKRSGTKSFWVDPVMMRYYRDRTDQLQADLAEARDENARLREDLKLYGEHKDYCGVRWTLESPKYQPCDCGLKQALKEKP